MSSKKVEHVSELPSRKKYLREREKYRTRIWGSLFLEILIRKMLEKELREIRAMETGTAKVVKTPWVSVDSVYHTQGELPAVDQDAVTGNADVIADAVFTASMMLMSVPLHNSRESDHMIEITAEPAAIDSTGLDRKNTDKASGQVFCANPWKLMDCLELSLEQMNLPAISESYNTIANVLKCAAELLRNQFFREISKMMQDYYEENADSLAVEKMFTDCCRGILEERREQNPKRLIRALLEMYEDFSYANARKAAWKNNCEGKELVESAGLSWAGTTYYNAIYYDAWKQMQLRFKEICRKLSASYALGVPDFDGLERESRYAAEGGLSFHGVFEWLQMQNNFPCGKYGFKQKAAEPPPHFVFLYRNGYSESEKAGVERLLEKMHILFGSGKMAEPVLRSIVRSGGMEYHNGRSYLLDKEEKTAVWHPVAAEIPQTAAEFLGNFQLYRIAGCAEILYAGELRIAGSTHIL